MDRKQRLTWVCLNCSVLVAVLLCCIAPTAGLATWAAIAVATVALNANALKHRRLLEQRATACTVTLDDLEKQRAARLRWVQTPTTTGRRGSATASPGESVACRWRAAGVASGACCRPTCAPNNGSSANVGIARRNAAWKSVDAKSACAPNGRGRQGANPGSGGREVSRKYATVCGECLRASCWQGVFMCENSTTVESYQIDIEYLRSRNLEHPSYWESGQ